MTRSRVREEIFKLLFRAVFYDRDDLSEQTDLFIETEKEEGSHGIEGEKEYITEKFNAIVERLPEIDTIINDNSNNWKTSRMGRVDLTILRLAVYEIRFEPDIPGKVSINEAVELAKKYGTDNSAGFVNGVLAGVGVD